MYNTVNMNNNLLIDFFQDLVTKLQNNEIEDNKLRNLSEFMFKYRFDNEKSNNCQNEDFIKFLTLGWYVYSNMSIEK